MKCILKCGYLTFRFKNDAVATLDNIYLI